MAKIPVMLESGRADGKLAESKVIYDSILKQFQTDINGEYKLTKQQVEFLLPIVERLNDVKDTLTSIDTDKPLSAQQGKILKELLDAKVIEAGSIPIDSEPTEGNINNIVNSDGIYKNSIAKKQRYNKDNTTLQATNVQDAIDEIVTRYGEIEGNSEYISVITDSENHIIEAIKEDGTKIFTKNVKAPNIEEAEKELNIIKNSEFINNENSVTIDLLSSKIIKAASPTQAGVMTKNHIITLDKASVKDENGNIQTTPLSIVNCPEFIYCITDINDTILFGILDDGSIYINDTDPIYLQKAITKLKKDVEKLLDKEKPLILPTSKYLNDIMTQNTDIVIPTLSKEQILYEIKNIEEKSIEEQFLDAINRYKNGESICISLKEDVVLSDTCVIDCSLDSELTIEGNSHKIYVATDKFDKQGIKYGLNYSEFLELPSICPFVTNTGDILRLNNSKFYEAESRITDENGNYLSTEEDKAEGIRRFKLPKELSDLNIIETDNVFINISTWFVSQNYKVIKTEYRPAEGDMTEGNYLYFQKNSSFDSNADYNYAKKFCSFFLINYGNAYEGITIKENKIFFPINYDYISYCNKNTFIINTNGTVLFNNINFIGGNINIEGKGNSKIIVKNCNIQYNNYYSLVNYSPSKLYVSKCSFSNLWGTGVFSESELYVCDCNFKNTGLGRYMNPAIKSEGGHYYIARNHIEDYGYGAIYIGLITMSTYKEAYGIVEYNTIKQSIDYLHEAKHRTLMDSGAIYVATNNNPYGVVRYNTIINYDGRYDNRGLFLDDGAYNIYCLGNILENIVNSRAIDARFATGRGTAGLTDNINKVFIYNICDQGIKICGRQDVENNGCYLGYNLFTNKAYLNNIIENIMEQEEQIYSEKVSIENGIIKAPIDALKSWSLFNK